MLDLDDNDQAFLADFLPEGAIPVEFVVALKFFRSDGQLAFKVWTPSDSGIDQIVGLLEVAKTKFLLNAGCLDAWKDDDDA